MAAEAYRKAEPDGISRAGEGQHEDSIGLLALIALLVPKCPPHLVPEHHQGLLCCPQVSGLHVKQEITLQREREKASRGGGGVGFQEMVWK